MVSGRGTTTWAYAFDARSSSLEVQGADGGYTAAAASSAGRVRPGAWMLALRLVRDEDRGTYVAQEDAAFIPVLLIEVSEAGEVSYRVYQDPLAVSPRS